MGFIGGNLRESFIGRIKGADPGQLLAVPIDVGKRSAAALVCDFWGEIIATPVGCASVSSKRATITVHCRLA